MFKFFSDMLTSKATKQAAKKQALRMQAFLAVYDNPVRATGCYGWKLKMSGSEYLSQITKPI
jgi:hypothetical protein